MAKEIKDYFNKNTLGGFYEAPEVVEIPKIKNNKLNKQDGFIRKRFILMFVLPAIFFIVGVQYYHYIENFVSTDNAFIEGHNIPISSKISGNISKIYIKDNQMVKEGDLILEIDPTDYQVYYEQVLARLETAIAKQKSASINVDFTSITSGAVADQANEGVAAAKARLLQAQQNINSLNAELDLAKIDYERYFNLYKKGASSKQDFDRAKTKFENINAQIKAAQANKDAVEKSLNQALGNFKAANTAGEKISMSNAANKMALAEIKQLKAAEKEARLKLSYTKIYAPKSGRITNRSIEEGTYVQTGQPLLSIVPDERWIVANFKETQLSHIKVGQLVYIKIDAYPKKVFYGEIDSIQSSTGSKTSLFPPENAVGSFVKVVQRVPVKINFIDKIDPKYPMIPGMSVIPEIKIKNL